MKYETQILHQAAEKDPLTGALSIPIYNASTYHQKDVHTRQEFDYGRSGNPTRKALEDTLSILENANHAFAFASGMAAITSSIMSIASAGDHIIASKHIYGGSYRLLTKFLPQFGINCTFVDTTDASLTEKAITSKTKILFLESPSNPMLHITDLKAMAFIAKKHKIVSMIDNTFLSPFFSRPLDLGIDISIHSCTKFLGGHSDLIAGAVVTKDEELANRLYFVQNTCGAVLNPQDSWLLLRGIKTLAVRMKQQEQSAFKIAKWLQTQEWVTSVYFPGLPEHPGHDVLKSQSDGFGAVVSFKCDTVSRVNAVMRNVQVWAVAVSLGGVESILSYPAKMSHASIPITERDQLGITDTLLRLSVGLEDPGDLIADLSDAQKS